MNIDVTLIRQHLQYIAETLQKKAYSLRNNTGLLQGKTGIALFLYLYADYMNDPAKTLFADELTDHIIAHITEHATLDYSTGLTGFGVAIEYLIRKGYIEADADEVLEDLDNLVNNYVHDRKYIDILGPGKYLAFRLLNSQKQKSSMVQRSRESIAKIMNMPGNTYNTCAEAMATMDMLNDLYISEMDNAEIRAYLDYATDKMETIVYEDMHFGKYPGTFNPLVTAVKLLQTAENKKDRQYTHRALFFLDTYEAGFRKFLDDGSYGFSSGAFKWAPLYNYVGYKLDNHQYKHLATEWLAICLKKIESLANNSIKIPCMDIWNGYAGMGLSLLSFMEGCAAQDWLSVIPFYLDKKEIID
ncbi:MAG TPA: hypothetical protein DEQ30_00945 [Porphyromonadaceae bacterium]|nr:hypothetical protein [Porphyromonadaceae bacterium]